MSQYNSQFFAANRQRLLALASSSTLVLTAHSQVQQSNDIAYPFVQDNNFWYLTGLSQPDLLLVMDKGRNYIILPEQNRIRDIFDGPYNPDAIKAISGVDEVVDYQEGWQRLDARLVNVKQLGSCMPAEKLYEYYAMYANPARANLIKRLQQANGSLKFEDIRAHLANMRMVKTKEELAVIKEAVNITGRALEAMSAALKPGNHEYNLEAIITASFLNENAKHAYEPIIAAGKNACIIHYEANDAKLKAGDLVLLDVGAAKNHGLADISRTYAISEPTKRQRSVFKAVQEVHEYAMSLLKPGVVIRDYEQHMEIFMGEQLRSLGLITGDKSEDIRHYFPHATSHSLGLDVHDVADYERPLEPMMVLTVEPGIYIPEESIGVRIEDNVVITKRGVSNLSKHIPLGSW